MICKKINGLNISVCYSRGLEWGIPVAICRLQNKSKVKCSTPAPLTTFFPYIPISTIIDFSI